MGVIKYKIWHDLWENKGRTLQVILIIAVGAFAVGLVIGTKGLMTKDLTRTWQASTPAMVGLSVNPAVDEAMIDTLGNLSGIETTAGWMQKTIQWRPTAMDAWEPAILIALDDYEAQEIRKITLDSGIWPHRKAMGVQRLRAIDLNETVELDINDTVQSITIKGIIYNVAQPPAMIQPEPIFYTTRERFTELTGEANYSLVLATIPNYSPERVEQAADLIQHELEKQDIEVNPAIPSPGGFLKRTSHPDRFIAQDTIDGVFLILTIMAGLSLGLGLFLVYNTVNAIILQQVSQIGVMKAIGGRFNQIVMIYGFMVIIYAGLALALAVPLGAVAAHGLRLALIEGRIGMVAGPFEIVSQAVIAQTVVALISPIVIAIIPILMGATITVREAISTYGLGGTTGLLDQALAKFEAIPRIITLTIGNTFRNKKRVALTQITLVGAGAIFMMVISIQQSLVYTFSDVIFSIFETNVMLDLDEAKRIKQIKKLALAHPDVKSVEVWGTAQGTARLMGQPETNDDSTLKLRGLPWPTNSYHPMLRAGRWLVEGDDYGIVLNQALANEMGVSVGDWITIDIPTKREANWQVVGLIFEPLEQDTAMVSRDTLLREIREVGRGDAIKIQTYDSSAETEARVATELRELYEAHNYEVVANTMDTAHRTTAQKVNQMDTLLLLLTTMAIMIAVVGVIALSGTLSINVLERTREIGVMRAIGASSMAIAEQFIGEGLILAWLSWLIAIPLSIPVGVTVLGAISAILNIELIYQFSAWGVLAWFGIITVLAVIASWFPARKATQTSVRDSLMYA